MNRLYILLTVMAVMVGAPFFFAANEALAEVLITGTGGNDTIVGTDDNDYLEGRSGDDYIDGVGGDDTIKGRLDHDAIIHGEGPDVVYAGAGNDRIYVSDTKSADFIDCGTGFDKVETIHRDDRTLSNCERALGPRQGNI